MVLMVAIARKFQPWRSSGMNPTTPKRKRHRRAKKTILRYIVRPTALKHVFTRQKREQPDIPLRLHASIRRQLKEGEKDPKLIASEALSDLQTYTPVHKPPGNGRRKRRT